MSQDLKIQSLRFEDLKNNFFLVSYLMLDTEDLKSEATIIIFFVLGALSIDNIAFFFNTDESSNASWTMLLAWPAVPSTVISYFPI